MRGRPTIQADLTGLRDFQRDTARYVFDRMFGGGEPTSRFLVADEVGLGKTMVARGVISQVIAHLQAEGDPRIDIVYVASNGAIATQNLRKLAPPGVEVHHSTDRLSMLPYGMKDLDGNGINLVALTPGTSISLGSSGGMLHERAALLAALRTIWSGHRLRGEGIAALFAGGVKKADHSSPGARLRALAKAQGDLDPEAAELFAEAVQAVDHERLASDLLGLDDEIHDLARWHGYRSKPRDFAQRRGILIRQLREAMASTGVALLKPDLVILDEFQRFRELLADEKDDWAGQIARSMFNYHHDDFRRSTRVLLLSATPYVMHTTSAEAAAGSDRHYDDFLATYRFLAAGLPGTDAVDEEAHLRRDLDQLRTTILDAPMTGAEPVRAAAGAVSERLTRVMVRTERLAATPLHDGMLTQVREPVGPPNAKALEQYIDTASVAEHLAGRGSLRSTDVVEYWKSAPYTLSYLGGHDYLLSKSLLGRVSGRGADPELLDMLERSRALLPWRDIVAYREVDPANGRLERLYADMFDRGAHRLLWMPPACPYYTYPGRFDTDDARRLTKRLVFSAWALVPTVVSTMTSFEAERRLHLEAHAARAVTSRYDTEASSRHTRHLQLRQGLQSMTAMAHRVPSPELAKLTDPLEISTRLQRGGVVPDWDDVLREAERAVSSAVSPFLPRQRGSGPGSGVWYALAPMLLDLVAARGSGYDPQDLDRSWFGDNDDKDSLHRYLDALRQGLWPVVDFDDEQHWDEDDPEDENWEPPEDLLLWPVDTWAGILTESAPLVPEDLEHVLALAGLGGAPHCFYRALARSWPQADVESVVRAACASAQAFVSLLNSWEATRIINAMPESGDYWLKALHYGAEGHLQAVLDEYVAALVDWRGYDRQDDQGKALKALVGDLSSVLSLRTSVYRVLREGDGLPERASLRGRFAVRFGDSDSEEQKQQRVEAVSAAFNSPFWPFVLTSTSVGQEGLDFHLYCHAVTHWNLPTNPVDLEQREGRVHRYKGHAVRKNVARSEGPPSGQREPWRELFDRAAARDAGRSGSEIVPYWVYMPDTLPDAETSTIERHLPISPYSREASRIGSLTASLAYYRLAFGQPRQEELINHVLTNVTDPKLLAELAAVRVDLSPPRHRMCLESPSTGPGARDPQSSR